MSRTCWRCLAVKNHNLLGVSVAWDAIWCSMSSWTVWQKGQVADELRADFMRQTGIAEEN